MLTGRKLALTLVFTGLVALAAGISCRGFFQPNYLLTVAVQPPSPNVLLGQTTTLQAWGTYQDGSRSLITSGVAWSSDTPDVLSFADDTSGVASGVSLGTANVTAAAQGLSGTASATVYLTVTSLTVAPNTWTFTGSVGGMNPTGFVVTANGTVDVTSTATFASSNTTWINCTNGTDPVFCTALAGTPAGPYTITVTYTGYSGNSPTIAVTAN